MNNLAYRQLMAGNLLDILFDCPYGMHNLTADALISRMLVDGEQPLRLCRHCRKVFLGSRSNAAFADHDAKTSTMSTGAVLKRTGRMKSNEEE